jgi:hypothetical protein
MLPALFKHRMKESYLFGSPESVGDKSSGNPENSREVPPPSGTPPERPSRESLWRGLRWIGVGTRLLALSKLTGDEAFYRAGLPITVLGGNEVFHALLFTFKK